VLSVRAEQRAAPVYNLEVEPGHLPEFFANGILVHNCLMTAQGYLGDRSPDRLDALVWALTELFPQVIRRERKEAPQQRLAAPGDPARWMAR
jgi:phage terminase large subunit-like protein